MLSARLLTVVLPVALVLGCDSGGSGGGDDAAKAAADKKAAEEAEVQKRIDERKKKRLAEEEEKKAAEAKIAELLQSTCVPPEEKPKKLKLDKACADVFVAQDEFMHKHYGDNPETIEKWDTGGKKMQEQMTVAQCMKSGSLDVALCQASCLRNAPTELKKEIPGIFKTCTDRFGPAPEPKPE